MTLIKKNKIYKIVHRDLRVGVKHHDFVVVDNSIIFSPVSDYECDDDYVAIDCHFLLTFDRYLKFNLQTGYDYHSCQVFETTEKDIREVVNLFAEEGKINLLSIFLKNSGFTYNRKLNKIIKNDA